MKAIYILPFAILCLTSCKNDVSNEEQTKIELSTTPEVSPVLSEAETIAIKHGLEKWKYVSQIDFTFNVDRGGKKCCKKILVMETKNW